MGEGSQLIAEITDAFNSHDEARIREGYAEDVRMLAPGAELEGVDAAVEYSMGYVRAFPDVRLETTNIVEGGDWIVAEFKYAGTNTGPLATPDGGEIPATGRKAVGTGVDIVRIVDGKVAEEHLYFDQLEFLTQLGIIPEQAIA
jgi:predicted ester cyclase